MVIIILLLFYCVYTLQKTHLTQKLKGHHLVISIKFHFKGIYYIYIYIYIYI